ncbi:unnamed protein product, partial [Rotaria sp. Silwood1]
MFAKEIAIQYIKLFYILFKHWFRDLFSSFTNGSPLKSLTSEIILITEAASGLEK